MTHATWEEGLENWIIYSLILFGFAVCLFSSAPLPLFSRIFHLVKLCPFCSLLLCSGSFCWVLLRLFSLCPFCSVLLITLCFALLRFALFSSVSLVIVFCLVLLLAVFCYVSFDLLALLCLFHSTSFVRYLNRVQGFKTFKSPWKPLEALGSCRKT